MQKMQNVVGLFGTCDGSQWRVPVIETLDNHGIAWYNPDAGANWEPWMVEEENTHLREDHIILFPILGESLGQGSLAEIGFSVLNIVRNITSGKSDQTLIVLIDDVCTDDRKTVDERKTSDRTRKLAKSKLAAVDHPNVYLVNTVDEMVALGTQLHELYAQKDSIDEQFRPTVADSA